MYKTKLTLEVDVETQFGPKDAVYIVKNLLNVLAVKSVWVENVETDYKLLTPEDENKHFMGQHPFMQLK